MKNPLQWSSDEWSKEDHQKLIELENLVFVYGLGYIYSNSRFSIVNPGWFTTDLMSLDDTMAFLRSYEEVYENEVWFRRTDAESRKKIIRRWLPGSQGE